MPLKSLPAFKAVLLICLSATLQADILVTQLANEGVIVSDGETRIMIDGMVVESYSVYGGLPPDVANQFDRVSGAFSGIDLALVSHRHHDHNQPDFACRFMQGSAATRLVSSPQVLGLMREKCRQFVTTSPRVREISPDYEQAHEFQRGSAYITVFPLSHGTRKYSRIQNYGHLIKMGGLNVLHVGDAAMDDTDFARFGLDQVEIDIALIPFWFFQPGPGERVVKKFMDAPVKIAVHIPPGEMEQVTAHMQAGFPEVIILAKPLDQASFSGTARPLP